jgi:HD-like signal output (HDOD) protein
MHPTSLPSFDRLLSRAGQLYSLPSVAAELVRLTDAPQVDANAIRRAVEGDPALAVKLLRVVNCSIGGLGGGVTDLGQAIALLGVRPLKLLVLGFALPDRLFDGVAGAPLRRYWTETLTRAAAARAIAELSGAGGDEALVAGLLQGIGQLVLLQQLGGAYADVVTKFDESASAALPTAPLVELGRLETELLGFDHRTLSGSLLRRWRLPAILCDAVESQADPTKIDSLEPDTARLARVLRLAELLTQLVARRRLSALAPLVELGERYGGITRRHINSLVGSLQERVDQLAEAMRVELERGRDYQQVLIAAHARLSIVAEEAAGQLAGQDDDEVCDGLLAEAERLRDAMRCFLETGDAELADRVAATPATIASPAKLTTPAPPRKPHHAQREAGGAALARELSQAIAACREKRQALTLALVTLTDDDGDTGDDAWRGANATSPVAQLRDCVRALPHANELHDAKWIAIDDATAAVLLVGAERTKVARWFADLARDAREATGMRMDVGVASLPSAPRGFEPSRLVEAAERCLAAACASASAAVKSIEVF